ncbi:hypothetical protein yfred0001_10250 [Yersinia frederiksenii ATCC 33641]|nr:hypothetical protein yfred0001_10250 [Yersinia frederiksenii ATCC 33641]
MGAIIEEQQIETPIYSYACLSMALTKQLEEVDYLADMLLIR